MNLQNLPRHDSENPDAAVIHRIFVPKLDALMFFDWKSMEAVVLAYYLTKTGIDDTFREKLLSGIDLHEDAGRAAVGDVEFYHGVPRRDVGKRMNYSLIYGGGAPTIAEQLGIPESAAAKAVKRYHAEQPGLRKLADALEASYNRKGYIRTLYGRELRVMKMHVLVNYLIQGSCAEIMKRSMLKVHHYLGQAGEDRREEQSFPRPLVQIPIASDFTRAHLVAAIHDEFVADTPEDQVAALARDVPELMRDKKIERYLPLEVDVEITRTNWSEKEAYVAA